MNVSDWAAWFGVAIAVVSLGWQIYDKIKDRTQVDLRIGPPASFLGDIGQLVLKVKAFRRGTDACSVERVYLRFARRRWGKKIPLGADPKLKRYNIEPFEQTLPDPPWTVTRGAPLTLEIDRMWAVAKLLQELGMGAPGKIQVVLVDTEGKEYGSNRVAFAPLATLEAIQKRMPRIGIVSGSAELKAVERFDW